MTPRTHLPVVALDTHVLAQAAANEHPESDPPIYPKHHISAYRRARSPNANDVLSPIPISIIDQKRPAPLRKKANPQH